MDRNNVRQILSQGAESAMTQKTRKNFICGTTHNYIWQDKEQRIILKYSLFCQLKWGRSRAGKFKIISCSWWNSKRSQFQNIFSSSKTYYIYPGWYYLIQFWVYYCDIDWILIYLPSWTRITPGAFNFKSAHTNPLELKKKEKSR